MAILRCVGTLMPRNWSPSPYWPFPVLKNQAEDLARAGSAAALSSASRAFNSETGIGSEFKMIVVPMSKPNLLVLSPPDHYLLRNLEAIKDAANIFVTAEEAPAKQFAPTADIVLFSGLTGKTVDFPTVFGVASTLKWVHSMSAGVEKLLFPAFASSTVPLTNARGVYKRSLAEFAVLGMLYFTKRVRRLVDNQRANKWDNFSTEFINNKVMGVVGCGEIGRECALLAKSLGVKIYATRRNPERSASDPILDKIFPLHELNNMLREVDFLVAAAPLTPEPTRPRLAPLHSKR